jgi:hypothetical protein
MPPSIDLGRVRVSMFNKERDLTMGGQMKGFFAPWSEHSRPFSG